MITLLIFVSNTSICYLSIVGKYSAFYLYLQAAVRRLDFFLKDNVKHLISDPCRGMIFWEAGLLRQVKCRQLEMALRRNEMEGEDG